MGSLKFAVVLNSYHSTCRLITRAAINLSSGKWHLFEISIQMEHTLHTIWESSGEMAHWIHRFAYAFYKINSINTKCLTAVYYVAFNTHEKNS